MRLLRWPLDGDEPMKSLRNSEGCSKPVTSRHQASATLLVMTAVVAISVATLGATLNAACPSYSSEYTSTKGGGNVPCYDTTTCFANTDFTILCVDFSVPLTYKNSAPPTDWYNCTPRSGGGSCSESLQTCGTTVWYPDSTCQTSCTLGIVQNKQFCRSSTPP